ncbi:MAG: CRISPR-associated protein Cas4 [Caldisericum sp. CG2_30_36_11]|nr:CRISPR-associated protein Cas4 [Caldisericota bacterium]OIP13911.1 MAG: CRISPR-associated protein Cas4 [Caldisericum sp. CG2_30_36_11]
MVAQITGVLLQSYKNCKRQAWLMAHQIVADQDNTYLALGRLIDEDSYKRNVKRVEMGNLIIDLVKTKRGEVLIGEVKKSSKSPEAAKLQLAYYLYFLKKNNVTSKGMLLFPKERKKIPVELSSELEKEVEQTIKEIQQIVQSEIPPSKEKNRFCNNCAYREFCWA